MNIKVQETADRLLNRIGVSTCSFTTVKAAKRTLEEEGACVLSMQEPHWDPEPGKTYLVTQSDSSLFAFSIGSQFLAEEAAETDQMLRLAAAHTDHPCLYIKSNPEVDTKGYGKLNVEVYGGAILNTWMDRALSVAGKVVIKSDNVFEPEVRIVDMKRPLFTIPNLAIHLNREVNKGVELNRQNDLEPLAFVDGTEAEKEFFLSLLAREQKVSASEILDY